MRYNRPKAKYGKDITNHTANVINIIRFYDALESLPNAREVAHNTVYITADDNVYDVAVVFGPKSGAFDRAKKCIANTTDFIARKAMRRKLLTALILKGYKVTVVCAG